MLLKAPVKRVDNMISSTMKRYRGRSRTLEINNKKNLIMNDILENLVF